jgi:cephalosporin-C deacetylase
MKTLRYTPALLATALFTSGLILAQPRAANKQADTIVPFHASGIYRLGDRAGWTVTLADPSVTNGYSYSLKTNNQVLVQSGAISFSNGKGTISIQPSGPTMLYLEVTTPESAKPMVFGAAVEPLQLKPVVERPKDFDSFWKSKIALLKSIPPNPVLTPGESGRDGVDYATIRMDHINGTHVYGQLATPKKSGKHPALLILLWASPPYPVDKSWVNGYAEAGWITLNIEPHDVLPTEPASYYQNLPSALKNYNSINMNDRNKSYFVEMYLRDYRAVDYLASRPDWDGKTLVVMGTSMGGQQTLAVAGLHKKITHIIVNEPAGCDLNASLHGRQMGYPFFPANDPKVMETARYVDNINFAPNIRAKTLMGIGFVDTVCPPAGLWAAFNLIKGAKEAAPMIDSPHNNTATPAQQLPITSRTSEWLNKLVRGEEVDVKPLKGR